MSLLSGKKILLGITGGIAAYKTPLLVRALIQQSAEVKVVMTPSSKDFVSPLTLSTLSKNPVLSTFTAEDSDNPVWNDHVELGQWADLLLVAPATANTLSSMVHGRCNNLLLAVYLSAKCPVFIAPAMDLDMYAHPSTQENINTLKSFGNHVLPVGEGFLASGLEGKGRALSVGGVKFSGMVLPTIKKLEYQISLKRVLTSKLILGIGDGLLLADGEIIYKAEDLRVGLFK